MRSEAEVGLESQSVEIGIDELVFGGREFFFTIYVDTPTVQQ